MAYRAAKFVAVVDDFYGARTLLAQAANLIQGQRGVSAVDMADDVGVGLQHHIRIDQARPRNGRAAGVDGALDAILARPRHHLLRFLTLFDAAEPNLPQQFDTCVSHLLEILFYHALLDHRRAGMHLHAAGTHVHESALRRYRQCFDPGHILRPSR